MSSLIDVLHRIVEPVVAWLVELSSILGDTWALILISAVAGVLLALIYGRISFQQRLRSVKKDIHGCMLESVLFRHSPVLALRSQGRMLIGGIRYFLLAVPPIVILAVPCIFIFGQLNAWFGYRALDVRGSVLLRAQVTSPAAVESASLRADEGMEVVGPLKDAITRELTWRIDPKQAGLHSIAVQSGAGETVTIELPVGTEGLQRIDPVVSQHAVDRLLFPAHRAARLPSSFEQIQVIFPEREISFLGLHSHWIITFLIVSLLAGFLAAKVAGVEL